MKTISIDLETFSGADLKKCGVYKYAESPDFEILLFGYSADGGEVQVVDLANGEKIPLEVIKALSDENVTKWAFNAAFERVCLSEYLRRHYEKYFESYSISEDTVGNYLSPRGWKCSMIWSAYMGLPLSLAQVGEVLGLEKQKLTEGKELIRVFSVPDKNGNRTPCCGEKWERFKVYNKRDVETEKEIQQKLSKFPVPSFVWEEYWLDQEINDRGIAIDMELADAAINLDEQAKVTLSAEMCRLTGVENPNSVYQLLDWLEKQGYSSDSLGKKQVLELMKTAEEPVKSVLSLRQKLAKSSVKKYQAMQNAACADSRARGCFQFYGANRTGRFSGRNIQLQNLPQNHIPDLTEARETVKHGFYDEVEMLYDDVPDTLSQLIRTALVPRKGYKFIVADFSAIEMRLSAYYAGEQWVIDTFANGGDIYCATASQMFGVPVEKHGINGELRQRGKQASLSCSYGGSVGALIAMGAVENGMKEEELKPMVEKWRAANPNIVKFWYDMENAALETVRNKSSAETHGLKFTYESGFMFIELPSGRRLAYAKPKIGENRFGGESLTYMGLSASKKWERLETFGGKLVENVIQAIARDILVHSMQTLSHCFIVAHVHDELIIEADRRISLDAVCEQMAEPPSWAKGLLLRADGYECEYYKKD